MQQGAGVTTTTFLDTFLKRFCDIIDQKRVDTINNFDFALDIELGIINQNF